MVFKSEVWAYPDGKTTYAEMVAYCTRLGYTVISSDPANGRVKLLRNAGGREEY